MRIRHYCTKCKNYDEEEILNIQPIPQDFVVRINCKKGHNQIIYLTNPLYSILFDNSVIALKEKNYRGCIFEAASALERFFEHALRILIIPHKDIGDMEKVKQYNAAWKLIKNMSERQLGAFVMLFHKTTSQSPVLLSEKLINLRNNTIHKGYIPDEGEALQFIGSIYELIQTNRLIIRPHDEEAFWLLDQRVDFENFSDPNNDPEETISYNGPHFFNSAFGVDFNDSLQ
ncbi:MAG: hypothetical protein ACK5QX_08700, partial [bacterium]